MSDFYSNMYNPDVLTCLANLSNDEVFTPPEVANRMLDMLPEELWHDSSATFLDPACKSGVFLREIAKRLIEGLKEEIPDLQERIDHIFHKQLYGIAITELTSLLSRRSVYCSKYPNSKYSITLFEDTSGNIRYKRIPHRWQNGKCLFCDMLEHEVEAEKRIIFRNEHFTVFLPFYCEYPYGVYIMSNAHKQYITDFTEEERMSLGLTIRDVVGMLDSLFDYKFPYMMCMHNAPVNSGDFSKDFHFHIEFFPPMRSADKQKFNASSETGAWACCNPTCPEETSKELRAAYAKYKENEDKIQHV